MRLSPPLAITGIIAASFAWMAWEYEPTQRNELTYIEFQCVDGQDNVATSDGYAHRRPGEGLYFRCPDGWYPVERKMRTIVYYAESPVYWLCEDGSREPVIRDQPNHCPAK